MIPKCLKLSIVLNLGESGNQFAPALPFSGCQTTLVFFCLLPTPSLFSWFCWNPYGLSMPEIVFRNISPGSQTEWIITKITGWFEMLEDFFNNLFWQQNRKLSTIMLVPFVTWWTGDAKFSHRCRLLVFLKLVFSMRSSWTTTMVYQTAALLPCRAALVNWIFKNFWLFVGISHKKLKVTNCFSSPWLQTLFTLQHPVNCVHQGSNYQVVPKTSHRMRNCHRFLSCIWFLIHWKCQNLSWVLFFGDIQTQIPPFLLAALHPSMSHSAGSAFKNFLLHMSHFAWESFWIEHGNNCK